MRRDGYTLIELLMVVLVGAIIASIALPTLAGNRDAAHKAESLAAISRAADLLQAVMISGPVTYAAGNDAANESALVARLQTEDGGSLTFQGYNTNPAANASAGPTNVSVSVEAKNLATVCSRTAETTPVIHCARVDADNALHVAAGAGGDATTIARSSGRVHTPASPELRAREALPTRTAPPTVTAGVSMTGWGTPGVTAGY